MEEQTRDCKACIYSKNEKCAGTEECHECMWENKFKQKEEIQMEIEETIKELERLREMVSTIYKKAAQELPYDKQHTLVALDIAIKSFKEQNNKI